MSWTNGVISNIESREKEGKERKEIVTLNRSINKSMDTSVFDLNKVFTEKKSKLHCNKKRK